MDNLAYIDDYFQGLLQPEEKDRFEKQLVEDSEFADEVAFYLRARQATLETLHKEKKAHFRELYKQSEKAPAIVRSLNKKWLYAAAAVFVLVAAGIVYLMQPPSGPQLAENYIQDHLKTLSVKMGTEENNLQQGLQLYNSGRLDEAARQFENNIKVDTADYTAKTYAGLAYLRLGNYEKAIDYFNQLKTDTTLRANPALFYLALSFLKRNHPADKEEAKRLLQEVVGKNLEGKETAEKWLKEL